MSIISVNDFYNDISAITDKSVSSLLPADINKQIGHFNIFNIEDIKAKILGGDTRIPYNRREYYKISLVHGRNIAEYADKVINIQKNALLFATPKIPYNYVPQNEDQSGMFCIFTNEFLTQGKEGNRIDELPIFKPGGYPIFELSDSEAEEIAPLFKKMEKEIGSNYIYKYDLIRNYLIELIHYGQKLQPVSAYNYHHNASERVSSLFIELLERQFPIASPAQKVSLRTAKDYADRLAVHSNHLNKVLKESTGKTTTQHIAARLISEAKILLKQTDWNISEIAYSLGFEQLSHFSNFFKKQTKLTPVELRNQLT